MVLQSNKKDDKTGERTCGKWRLLLFQTLVTPGTEGQEGKQKPENDMPVTRPLSASEHLVH